MPRHTLPPQMKKFSSFEILLTQTTEDEIWSYFETVMPEFEKKSKLYVNTEEQFLNEMKEYNPYGSEYFSGFERPSRITFNDCFDERQNFEMFDFAKKFRRIQKDLELCETHLFDNEEDEKREKIFEWNKNISNYFSDIQFLQLEFKYIDDINYEKSRVKYVEKFKKYKEEQDRKTKHSNHFFEEGPDSYMCYGKVIYYKPECQYCMVTKQNYDSIKSVVEENLQKQKEIDELWIRNQEILKHKEIESNKEAEEDHDKALASMPMLCCVDCGFNTKSKYEMDLHNKTKDHVKKLKLKEWFCKCCETQARSEIEWISHINSKKHKKMFEFKSNMLTCEACEYTTTIKCNFDKHCQTKRHIELTQKV